jgi:hypothetical protein
LLSLETIVREERPRFGENPDVLPSDMNAEQQQLDLAAKTRMRAAFEAKKDFFLEKANTKLMDRPKKLNFVAVLRNWQSLSSAERKKNWGSTITLGS